MVTIFNKHEVNGTEKWQRTVLKGVYWNSCKGTIIRKTGVASADSAVIIIPKSINCNRKYIPPKQWRGVSDKSAFWTLQSGDTIIKGDIKQEVIKSSAELQSFDDCLIITTVDSKDFGGNMAHWEVGAK